MTRSSLLAIAFVAATAATTLADAPNQVIVCSSRHIATVQRVWGDRASVIELLPEKIAGDLIRAGDRLAELPRVDVCVWDSSGDSHAEAMWVERLGRKHASCQILDLRVVW
jgi:hypothetical protein